MTYNWKNTTVTPNTPLMKVLEIIDKEALRIALVVDDGGKLIGTLTDGDVRRALIKHGNLEIHAQSVMNINPTIASEQMSTPEIDALMQKLNILAIPIVNDSNLLIGLHTLGDLNKGKIRENPVFIMAGGFGTRLKPLTDNCPKPMLKVNGKPILETILDSFLEVGFRNFFFSTHYLPEVIQNHFGDGTQFGCNITYIHEETPLGTGGALGLLPSNIGDLPIIMINGDILTKVDIIQLLEDHENKSALATMGVTHHQYQVPYGVIKENDGNLVNVDEKPIHSFFVNAGIYVIGRELLNYVPKNMKIDLPPLLLEQVNKGKKVNLFPIHEYWLDIGQHNEFKKAQEDLKGFIDAK